MVLDIAAKVFKETHVGENSCGEKARSSSITFKSLDEILRCEYPNDTSSALLSHGEMCFVYTVFLTFESVNELF